MLSHNAAQLVVDLRHRVGIGIAARRIEVMPDMDIDPPRLPGLSGGAPQPVGQHDQPKDEGFDHRKPRSRGASSSAQAMQRSKSPSSIMISGWPPGSAIPSGSRPIASQGNDGGFVDCTPGRVG